MVVAQRCGSLGCMLPLLLEQSSCSQHVRVLRLQHVLYSIGFSLICCWPPIVVNLMADSSYRLRENKHRADIHHMSGYCDQMHEQPLQHDDVADSKQNHHSCFTP